MFGGMDKKGIHGLVIESTPFMASHERNIIDSLVRYRIAAIHSLKRFGEAGGFMSYGAGFSEIYRVTLIRSHAATSLPSPDTVPGAGHVSWKRTAPGPP
jgi:hypothetical protein